MSASELLLAAIMLSAPFGTPETVPSEEQFSLIQKALHDTAIRWEIMDEREIPHYFARPETFQTDLDLLRRRYHDLQDAPKIGDCKNLPNRKEVDDFIKFNRQYKQYLESRKEWEIDRADLLEKAIRETDKLYRQWECVRDAQCDFYLVSVRRYALKNLREEIGENNYKTGKMPAYIPEWSFSK